jgi:flagellin
MGLRINTNIAAIAAQRELGKGQERENHALRAISSGNRIVRPADDAAGLAISENLRGELGGIKKAKENAGNALALIQVAEGGLNEQTNILVRLRELSLQSASDTIDDRERGYLDNEFQQLSQELDRIAKTTNFGSKTLLTGNGGKLTFHIGPYGGKENRIVYNLDADTTASNLNVDGLAIKDRDDAEDNLEKIDKAINKLGGVRANFGAIQSRLQATSSNLDTQYENLSEARSRISDADIAYETGELAQAQVQREAQISVLAQANQTPSRAIKLING